MADNIIYMNQNQNNMIGLVEELLKNVKAGELQNLFVLSIDKDGILKMGRAGGFTNIQDYILLIGGFELHKSYVKLRMEEATYDESEEDD